MLLIDNIKLQKVYGFAFCFYGAMAQWLRNWIPNPGVLCSRPLDGSKVDSAFHHFEVD